MDFIKPSVIQDSNVISTNVPNDAGVTLWDIGQTIVKDNVRRYEATNKHWIVRALQDHTTSSANAPTGLNTDEFWVYQYDTNPNRMFDNSSTSQSSNAELIDVTLAITDAVNSVALINVEGQTATVTVSDLNDTVVYTRTEGLIRTDNVYDWWTYFFAPIERKTDVVLSDIPIYYLSKVRVQVVNEGGTAKLGAFIAGQYQSAGFTEYGMKLGIRDFSYKDADEFGNYVITERRFSKTMTLTSVIEAEKMDAIKYTFDALRATPIVYIGSTEYSSSYVYGFYKDCYIVAQYPTHSVMNIEIEGLA